MIKFTSLLIGSGDSFLIENGNELYLVDSGGSKNVILSMIPEKINLAICTHNDSDHCMGFIGILKSKKHKIEEIWLPGVWASVIDFLQKWEFNFEFSRNELENINMTDINIDEILVDVDERIENFTDELGFLSDLHEYSHKLHFLYHHIINSKIRFNIDRILQIAKLAYEKGVAIKWFFPDPNGDIVLNNFRPINCKHLLKMKRIYNNNLILFLKLVYLTSENEHSLVFEYQIDKIPRILFTADSLISISAPYTNQIIVTAPHHGSYSNRQVYSSIKGSDILWVRSDRPSSNRPCQDFLNLKNKYCLSCTKQHPIKRREIIFKYREGKWINLGGEKCECEKLQSQTPNLDSQAAVQILKN